MSPVFPLLLAVVQSPPTAKRNKQKKNGSLARWSTFFIRYARKLTTVCVQYKSKIKKRNILSIDSVLQLLILQYEPYNVYWWTRCFSRINAYYNASPYCTVKLLGLLVTLTMVMIPSHHAFMHMNYMCCENHNLSSTLWDTLYIHIWTKLHHPSSSLTQPGWTDAPWSVSALQYYYFH